MTCFLLSDKHMEPFVFTFYQTQTLTMKKGPQQRDHTSCEGRECEGRESLMKKLHRPCN